jgi:hypothetical protein
MTLAETINDRVLALFNLRLTRASVWRQQQEEWKRRQEKQQCLDSLAASNASREKIVKLASFLTPHRAVGHSKVRLGGRNDGGYVCLSDFNGIEAGFSFGIAEDATWDNDLANRGIIVHQVDHTIDSPPIAHSNFRFQKKKLVSVNNQHPGEETIASLLSQHVKGTTASAILKMDIEHDEWQIFSKTLSCDLNKFSQIICEFHNFSAVIDEIWYEQALAVFKKLHEKFAVIHVHGNNFLPWTIIGGVPFPELLEVTFANRARYALKPSDEIFPTALDAPNVLGKADLFLGRFVFSNGD